MMRVYKVYFDYMYDYGTHQLGKILCYEEFNLNMLGSEQSKYLVTEGFCLLDNISIIGKFRNCKVCLINLDFGSESGFIVDSYRNIMKQVVAANIRNKKIESILYEVV